MSDKKAATRAIPSTQDRASASSNHFHVDQVAREVHVLSADACDAVLFVHDCHQAYVAVEMLLTPVRSTDGAEMDLDRSQLGALFRVLNEAMRIKIEEAVKASARTHGIARSHCTT